MDAPSSATKPSRNDPRQRALEDGFVAREQWAFEAAYAVYRRALYGAAWGVLHDAQSAEDCVHDVLIRLWQRSHAYRPQRGDLGAFLTVCVRNEALSRRRRDANRLRVVHDRLHEERAQNAEPEAALDLRAALQALSEPQRRTLELAYFEGLTHEEIARRLDEPLGTIKSRLSSALKGLRSVLRAQGDL